MNSKLYLTIITCVGALFSVPDASMATSPTPSPTTQCNDGADNDGDGKIDYQGGSTVTGSYASGTIASNGSETTLATGLVAGQQIFLTLSGSIRIDSGGSTVQCSTGAPSAWPIHVPAGRFYNASGVAVSDWIQLPPLASAGFVIPPGATSLRGRYPDDYYRDNAGSCQVSNIYTTVTALPDPGCGSASDNDERDIFSQCQDGIDNDGDGKIDGLIEHNPTNGLRITVGGTGNPEQVRAAVDAAIVAKKLPFARPTRDALVRSDSASWPAAGTTDTGTEHLQTLSAVCRILGYRDYVSSTCRDSERSGRYPHGKCNFHSPGDNVHWRLRNGNLVVESANPKYGKTWIASITCVNQLAACNDGWDNDGDGLVDRADPGCASDNDISEGAHDPKCAGPNDSTEAEQCRNTIDDDNDGLVDASDPGCWTNPTVPSSYDPNRNNESAATSQCQDGKDNDSDGATDLSDFSCSSPTDNDETNPKSQCQNTTDDDSDGLIDLKDPGCSSAQDNSEEGEAALLTVGVECVTENVDGSKTAYLSYNNTTGANLSVSTNASLGTLNELAVSPSSSQVFTPPALFKAGLSKGSVAVTFTGTSLRWSVRAPSSALSTATTSATTPVCAAVQPLAECQGFQSGRVRVKVGYRNDNTFEQQFAVGALNSFSPGATDRGQPNRFFAGLNKSVFEVDLFDNQTNQPLSSLTWSVNGITTVLNNKLPVCADACTDTPIGTINSQLDGIAGQMTQVMKKAIKILETSRANLEAQNPRAQAASRGRTDVKRATKKANKYLADFQRLLLKLPAVVKTCPEAPPACATVDNGTTIDGLRALYGALRNSTQRTIARSYFRNTGSTNRKDKLVKQAKDLEAQGREALKTLPRFATECK